MLNISFIFLSVTSGILLLIFIDCLENGKSKLFSFQIFLAEYSPNNGSFVKQYPPTPNPGCLIFAWVGLNLIASITLYMSIFINSANLAHSSINAIFVALKLFSKILPSSQALMLSNSVNGNFLTLIILLKKFLHLIDDDLFKPAITLQ